MQRKTLHIVFLILSILAGLIVLWELFQRIFAFFFLPNSDASIGIIGGADGPTAILVTGSVGNPTLWIGAGIVLTLAVIGISITRKKR